jgi:hypothetical protein
MEENNEEVQMTPEQMVEMIEAQTIKMNKAYMLNLRRALDFVEELDKKPDKDRLRNANIISQLIGILIVSIKGWQSWLNFNSMDSLLNSEEMNEIAMRMKKLVNEWIEIDLLVTEMKTGNIEKEYEEKKTKQKTSKLSRAYVS